MYQETIDQFYEFLQTQKHECSTIRDYIRVISDLDEPLNACKPATLLDYVDNAIQQKKDRLSKSNFAIARASLNTFFYMKTGIRIHDVRKHCIPADVYDQLLNQYISYCRDFLHLTETVTQASVREVRLFLKSIVPDPEHVVWSNITANDVIEFLTRERSELCTASIGVTVTAIRRFFRFLQYRDFEIHSSILTLPLSVPNWSKGGGLPITLSSENQISLDNYAFPDTPVGLRDRAILYCFTELGLRCNEVAKLQLTDIHWNRGTIIIRKTKTHSERELPLSIKLGQALENYVIKSRPSELGTHLFFKSKRQMSEPASTENIRSAIRRLYSKNGITGWHVGTHALRRTVGSHLYNAGNDLKTVADILGHTSISTTKAYVRIDIESLLTVASPWPGRFRYEE